MHVVMHRLTNEKNSLPIEIASLFFSFQGFEDREPPTRRRPRPMLVVLFVPGPNLPTCRGPWLSLNHLHYYFLLVSIRPDVYIYSRSSLFCSLPLFSRVFVLYNNKWPLAPRPPLSTQTHTRKQTQFQGAPSAASQSKRVFLPRGGKGLREELSTALNWSNSVVSILRWR